MRKTVIAGLIASIAIATNAYAGIVDETYVAMEPQENIQPIRFRGLEWGAYAGPTFLDVITPDMVADEDYYFDTEEMYLYVGSYSVAGHDMCAIYWFTPEDEQLYMGTYLSTEKHSNKQQYYLDFLDLQESLSAVYGEVTLSNDNWITDVYKGYEDKYGTGICMGNMEFCRGWKSSDGAAVVLYIGGDNGNINLALYYFAPFMEFESKTDGL